MTSVSTNNSGRPVEESGWTDRIRRVLDEVRRIVIENPFDIHESEGDTLIRKMNRLEERLNENRLKIAMIGAFSSGKSTFVNALLAQKVLKSAKKACTAAVTEIRHGSNDIVVEMKEGGNKRFSDTHKPVIIDKAFTDFLKKYQADNAFAENVESICVTLEKDILDNDAILLDTPGFNSGDDLHQDVIERALTEEADAGVFLFSAQIAADLEDMEILERFKDKLGTIFFVVTKIDKTDKEDQTQEVIENVQAKLNASFDWPIPPRVAGVAPLRVLKEPQGEYASEFSEFKRTLLTFSKTRKLFILTRGAISVLEQAIETLQKRAKSHGEKLAAEQQRVKKLQRMAPEDFIEKEMELARKDIQSAKKDVSRGLHGDVNNTWSKHTKLILNLVDKASDEDREELHRLGLARFNDLQLEIRNRWERSGFLRLESEANKIARSFEKRFKEYYENLEELETPFVLGERVVIPIRLSPLGQLETMLRNDLLSLQEELEGVWNSFIHWWKNTIEKEKIKWEYNLSLICEQLQNEMSRALGDASQYLMREIVDRRVNQYATTYKDDIQKEIRLVEDKLNDIGKQKRDVEEALQNLSGQRRRLETELSNLETLDTDIQKIEAGDVRLNPRLWTFVEQLISLCRQYDYDEALSFLLEHTNRLEAVPALLYMEGIFKRRCGVTSSSPFNRFFASVMHDELNLLGAFRHLAMSDFQALASTYYAVDYSEAPLPAKELLARLSSENAHPEIAVELQLGHLTNLMRQGTRQIENLIEDWDD